MNIERAECQDDEKVSIRVISEPSSIFQMERVWNSLVKRSSENPFLLSGFVEQFIESNGFKGWAPLIIVISADNRIIGIAPLMAKKKFGVQCVRFLHSHWFSPDFIFQDQYRETCMAGTLDFLFRILKCKFAILSLPEDSQNFRVLRQLSRLNKIHFCTQPIMGHCVLPRNSTWTEFERFRGKISYFKKIERKLDRAGSWKIECADGNDESDTVKKIFDVERTSWKESWRIQKGIKIDGDLLTVLKASQHTAKIEPSFKWNVWFLELNNQTLAYNIILQYKKVAFMTKMSYDSRYKRYYPGMHLANSVIRELFKKEQVESIDFLTELPFMRNWTSISLKRTRAMLSKGIIPNIAQSVLEKTCPIKSPHLLFDQLPFHSAM